MKKIFYSIFSLIIMFSAVAGISLLTTTEFLPFNANGEETQKETIFVSSSDQFISALNNIENFNNKKIVLENDIDFEGKTFTPSLELFTSDFDGNGFTISNITLAPALNAFGLFPKTSGSNIKNLKLDGNIIFDITSIKDSHYSQLYMSPFVGFAENTIIENCEIDTNAVIKTKTMDAEKESFELDRKTNFGLFAGSARNNTLIKNCIANNQENIIFELAFQEEGKIYIGGVAGSLIDSNVIYSISYSNFYLSNYLDKATISLGGIAGYVEGNKTSIYDTLFLGDLSKENDFNDNKLFFGSIVGEVVDKTKGEVPNSGNISYSYYNNQTFTAFGKQNEYKIENSDYITYKKIDSEFIKDANNWYQGSEKWDFDTTWLISNSKLHLQVFQTFNFSFNTNLDLGGIIGTAEFKKMENTTAVVEEEEQVISQFKYGEQICIDLTFKDSYFNYYYLEDIMITSNRLDRAYWENNKKEKLNTDGVLTGYQIFLTVSDIIDGEYSFVIKPKIFNCLITTTEDNEDGHMGGFDSDSGSLSPLLTLPLTYESQPQTIVAKGKDIYNFTHWSLYYFDKETNDWSNNKIENFEGSTNEVLTIEFKKEPWTREFKLVANFSDAGAMELDFSYANKDAVKNITISGKEYAGESLKVTASSTDMYMYVTVNAGYEMLTDNFVDFIKNYYGELDTSKVLDDIRNNEDGTKVYVFRLNIAKINEKISDEQTFVIPLAFNFVQVDGENDLTWLYITLPVVAVVLAGGIVALILIRRKKGKDIKKIKSKKEKSIDYKDYYS